VIYAQSCVIFVLGAVKVNAGSSSQGVGAEVVTVGALLLEGVGALLLKGVGALPLEGFAALEPLEGFVPLLGDVLIVALG